MKQQTTMIVVIVAFALALGFVLGSPLLAVVGFDSSFHSNGWGAACGGNNPTTGSDGQFLDQDSYVASWTPNLIGQRVTMSGGVSDAVGLGIVDDRMYKLFLRIGTESMTVYESHIQTGTSIFSGIRCYQSAYWDIKHPDGKTVIPEGAVI